ncbi:MAG: Fe-only nitrogenase accessory AnfO family protein [Bacillota bacterium]
MPSDIAVYVGETGYTATPLYDEGKLVIYRKQQGTWQILKEKGFSLELDMGVRGLRRKMEEVLYFLGNCRIFVGLTVVGIPYFELEKARCNIWEVRGKPDDFLNHILENEEKIMEQKTVKKSNVILTPVETSMGNYKLSLIDIQHKNAGLTSKQVLLPFLRKGGFQSLEVICSHVPPWLEIELLDGHFLSEVVATGQNVMKILISRK